MSRGVILEIILYSRSMQMYDVLKNEQNDGFYSANYKVIGVVPMGQNHFP